ncbi:multidrug ABC transporter ATP-binding protein [Arthrobacter livingstonensis]|uniref:Multidrug ABC transporter ATP-binding protein n=1 Tax=Arthrobacter livingstonensis TaxID=670078 RepID=A0A2V5L721_9MICC|nr:ABC transporter ATP-binding protein [Arthrobacter livingstonensis]PYI66064.1 multidrug ABC transporter ATP-binding protein [Arthrobacter livingstonensis]
MSHRAALPNPATALHPPVPADPAAGTGPGSVTVKNLLVHRGKADVLQDLSFTIPAGRITGLLGPSGSGKTTLIRALVGVQRITSGTVRVLGRPAGDPSLRNDVGYVTQAPSVYRDLSVLDNVRYFGAMHGRGRADALEAVAAVGLGDFLKRKAADLSGGQFNRVSLACALVSKPPLLFLDEPTVGLDPVLRADLWAQFADMAAAGTTLVISSHVMEEAGHCDSLLLLRDARLLAQLTPAELRRRGGTDDLELAFLHLIRADEQAQDATVQASGGSK